jgi:hypothetical protein
MTANVQGPFFPGTVVNDTSVGVTAWTNVNNVKATDGVFATATLNNTTANYINCQNFGFNIPSGVTISGVECNVLWKSSSFEGEDNSVRLIKGGTISGTNQAGSVAISSTLTTYYYPDYSWTTSLWGLTLLPSDVNSSTFGVAINAAAISSDDTVVSVDSITLTVYYYTNATAALFPGTAANVVDGSDTAWTNPNNIKATDGNYATITFSGTGTSDYLEGTNFGFAIPSNATINGIGVVWSLLSTDVLVSLIKGGTIQGTNYAGIDSLQFSGLGTLGPVGYGGPSDLWGLTLAPSDVNSSNFGAVYQGQESSSKGGTLNVDSVTITVYYTLNSISYATSLQGQQLISNGKLLQLAF